MYIPPFTVSPAAINLVAEISAQMERFAIRMEQSDGLRLRNFMLAEILKTLKEHQGEALPEYSQTDSPLDRQFGATFGCEFGVKFGIKFGDNDKQLLLLLNSNPGLTAAELSERLGITKRGVEKAIKRFRDLNILERKGSSKNGLWVINR